MLQMPDSDEITPGVKLTLEPTLNIYQLKSQINWKAWAMQRKIGLNCVLTGEYGQYGDGIHPEC